MSRPSHKMDATTRVRAEAAQNFPEGTPVRVVTTRYTKGLPYLQKGSMGTVAPREAWHLASVVEVRMDGDAGEDTWPWYPEELEASL